MKHVLMSVTVLAAVVLLLAAGGCATTGGGEPEIRTVEVAVPVVKPCPDARATAPDYPDTDAAIRAAIEAKDLPGLVKILLAARPLHYQRHAEDNAQIAACAGGSVGPMPPP